MLFHLKIYYVKRDRPIRLSISCTSRSPTPFPVENQKN